MFQAHVSADRIGRAMKPYWFVRAGPAHRVLRSCMHISRRVKTWRKHEAVFVLSHSVLWWQINKQRRFMTGTGELQPTGRASRWSFGASWGRSHVSKMGMPILFSPLLSFLSLTFFPTPWSQLGGLGAQLTDNEF